MKIKTKTDDMTSKSYWDSRQSNSPLKNSSACAKENEWSLELAKILKNELNQGRMLEIGCNPGYASLSILKYIDLEANGVDFNRHDKSFIENISKNGYRLGGVDISDIRQYSTDERFDLVFSCGFVEHFDNFQDLVKIHNQFVRRDGYILIVIPNFRYIQWFYHYIFDGSDLSMHNIKSMNIGLIEQTLQDDGVTIVKSGYAGALRFWNYDSTGGFLRRNFNKYASLIVRFFASTAGILLPKNNRFYSLWLYVLGRNVGKK